MSQQQLDDEAQELRPSPQDADPSASQRDTSPWRARTRIVTDGPAIRNKSPGNLQPYNSFFSPTSDTNPLSPNVEDRVFPIRSVVSVDPTPTASTCRDRPDGYFYHSAAQARASRDGRRESVNSASSAASDYRSSGKSRQEGQPPPPPPPPPPTTPKMRRGLSNERLDYRSTHQTFNDIVSSKTGTDSAMNSVHSSDMPGSPAPSSARSVAESLPDPPLVTARFKHVVTEGGHAVMTGRGGETLQRCEDEPIHVPGAVQGFGVLVALEEESDGKLIVRVVSENSKRLLGYSPGSLFALDNFCDILSEEQADNLMDHIDFIRDEDADVATNGPEVFTLTIRSPEKKARKFWCAMHVNQANPNLVICEFELEDDPINPLVPTNDATPELPEDTLQSNPTAEEYAESTQNISRPLRVLRSARKRKGEAAAMEVFNIMSQVQEQLATAPNLEKFLKVLVGVVKELAGFHRVMVYQFDTQWNGRVVTELVDPRATKDLYKGLNFPASDIPKQARELYKINKVRMLYDRDQETARLVCRTVEDLETPLDLTYTYLRAMSPIHLKYLKNMAVRSSMSISINAFDELWGLIACHSYGPKGMRVSFPIRKMCRLVGDSASRNIERLSYASRLQARKLINTVPTRHNPSGYIVASSEDLLKLFDADFGLLSIRDETKILGQLEQSQEALAMLEYLRMRKITSVMTSQDISIDFPDLRYPPGFQVIAGTLVVPLSVSGNDFIVFFRKGQLKEVKWAGNPYEKFVKEGTEYLEPRKSFKTWCETVVGKCREWTEEEIETAAVLCLVYGKFIEVWRQKEAALQSSQLTRLLLANSAHEVRTPLNAIINYLEIALEGSLDQETRENLAKSHSASKSLIYVINDLLDLTKTEEGGPLIRGEVFDLKETFAEATDMFTGDAKRKRISYNVVEHPGVPQKVLGDQRRVRQAISNVTANAIQNTLSGGVQVDMYVSSWEDNRVNVEVAVADTGAGMSSKKLDALFRDLEQVQSETTEMLEETLAPNAKRIEGNGEERRSLGLGLAVVARIIRNMNGQLRLKSEEGKGSRFVIQFPFDMPDGKDKKSLIDASSMASLTPQSEGPAPGGDGRELTLVDKGQLPKDASNSLLRRDSSDSVNSKKSMKSVHSASSAQSVKSGKSDVDRLIEAIQEPHMVDSRSQSQTSVAGSLPTLERGSTSGAFSPETRARSAGDAARRQHSLGLSRPGESNVTDSGQPVRAVRVPEEFFNGPDSSDSEKSCILGEVDESRPKIEEPPNADNMRVLVAEDDPVNSRIVKKRVEKIGHEVTLTVNGEECATVYGEKPGYFDVILMDMQMPIVDGLTSTKMIRSYEESHPSHVLSTRAALNGRIPIIAVSASLEERERQTYMDAGFDAWILKPIAFARLQELMQAIIDRNVREAALYKPGEWERGGWFHRAQPSVFQAQTEPNEEKKVSSSSQPSEARKMMPVADTDGQAEERTVENGGEGFANIPRSRESWP